MRVKPWKLGSTGRHLRRIERRKRAGPVVEIRHRDDVAGVGEPLRHHVEVRADAERVHVEDHGRPCPAAGRLEDVAVEDTIRDRQIDLLSRHQRLHRVHAGTLASNALVKLIGSPACARTSRANSKRSHINRVIGSTDVER